MALENTFFQGEWAWRAQQSSGVALRQLHPLSAPGLHPFLLNTTKTAAPRPFWVPGPVLAAEQRVMQNQTGMFETKGFVCTLGWLRQAGGIQSALRHPFATCSRDFCPPSSHLPLLSETQWLPKPRKGLKSWEHFPFQPWHCHGKPERP
jgi:hypothetical protein